jgi:hypothetical protein
VLWQIEKKKLSGDAAIIPAMLERKFVSRFEMNA